MNQNYYKLFYKMIDGKFFSFVVKWIIERNKNTYNIYFKLTFKINLYIFNNLLMFKKLTVEAKSRSKSPNSQPKQSLKKNKT